MSVATRPLPSDNILTLPRIPTDTLMLTDPTFPDLLARVRAGDERASSDVFHRFASRLLATADDYLGDWLRTKEDPEDVVQSVYRTFFEKAREGKYELADWGDLWALLSGIAWKKCSQREQLFLTQKRDRRRERHWHGEEAGSVPSHEHLLALREEVNAVLDRINWSAVAEVAA